MIKGTRYIAKNLVKNKFSLAFNKAKDFTLNVQIVDLPEITVEFVDSDNPFINRPMIGTKMNYGELGIAFVIDDIFNSYGMIYDWLRSYAPVNQSFMGDASPEFDNYRRDLLDVDQNQFWGTLKPEGELYDTASLIINNSSNIPELEIRFVDIFPVSLSSLPFDISAGSDDLVICTANFKFWYYTVHRKPEF